MSQFISQLTHPIKIQQTAVVASGMVTVNASKNCDVDTNKTTVCVCVCVCWGG